MFRKSLVSAALGSVLTCASPNFSTAAIVSGNYFEDSISMNCNGMFGCTQYFAPLPETLSGKSILIREINCSMNVGLGLQVMKVYINDSINGYNARRGQNIAVNPSIRGGFGIQQSMYYLIAGGPPRVLSIYMVATNTSDQFTGSCSISGDIK